MKYNIKKEEVVFDDHYKMLKAEVSYDQFKGEPIETKRLTFYRGDSVALLAYHKDSDSILLTEQFRYPTTKHEVGWLLEIPAGSIEESESPLDCVKRESIEEIGYKLFQPKQIFQFYVSPGACTERCFLFYAEVSEMDKVSEGGGQEQENEDIRIVNIKTSEIEEYLQYKIIDGKTILALQWFQKNINP